MFSMLLPKLVMLNAYLVSVTKTGNGQSELTKYYLNL